MATKSLKKAYAKFAQTPEHVLKSMLLAQQEPVSVKGLWTQYTTTPEYFNLKVFRSFTHFKRGIVLPLLKKGILMQGRAADLPKFKYAGMQQPQCRRAT